MTPPTPPPPTDALQKHDTCPRCRRGTLFYDSKTPSLICDNCTGHPERYSALQKARELMQDLEDIGNMEGTRANVKTLAAFSVWQDSLSRAFPSIHAELEKVTAERDELLKGYRAMRNWIIMEPCGCENECDRCRLSKNLLNSFPEIK